MYAINTGVKNLLAYDVDSLSTLTNNNSSWSWSGNKATKNGLTLTFNADGTINAVSDGATTDETRIYLYSYTNKPIDLFKISGVNRYCIFGNLGSSNLGIRFSISNSTAIIAYDLDDTDAPTTFDITEANVNLPVAVWFYFPSGITINRVLKPMICLSSVYEQDSSFAPPSLPNYDLTRLESEDRASLAEVVDSGAKNLFDNSNAEAQTNLVWDSSSGTATQGNDNDTKTNLAFKLQCRSGSSGSWTEIFMNHFVYANGVISIPFTCPINAKEFQFGHNGSTKDATMILSFPTSISSGTQYVIQCNVLNCLQASGKYSWNKIMICTKAAFGVSQKFVPYRPSWDLVGNSVDYTTRMNVTQTSTVANANLNNISVSEERVYNNPTSLPSGTSGYVICKTVVCDAQSAYQEIRFISSQINTTYGQSYPVFDRRKVSGTWRDWHILDIDGSYRLDNGSSNATSKTIDISNIPDGVFLVTTRCSISATNRVGVSVYILWIISSNYASSMFKSISETTNAKISSFSIASDGTATITYDGSGYHTTSLTRISI